MGKVNLDFVITLPKALTGNIQSVAVTPFLHRDNEDIPLEDLTIRGNLFSRVQERNYWQYDRYSELFKPGEADREKAFNRFVNHPYPENVRLDSIVEKSAAIACYYTQEVKTNEISGKKILITLKGNVVALDHSRYDFPLSDTLVYTISSMLSFTDTATRYKKMIIEKYVVVQDKNYLNFKVNDTRIIDSLAGNAGQLERIEELMNSIINQNEFHVDSIILTASASPEGAMKKNEQLAKGRAHALREHLLKKFRGYHIDKILSIRWVGEDWEELVRLIEPCDEIGNRERILAMIAGANSDKGNDKDKLEKEIKRLFPQDYRYIFDNLYPLLRTVNFKYDLRRVGMVKDTLHTTVPDEEYAKGMRLLNERKYARALEILEAYEDRNTAVAMLSIGWDKEALEILDKEPKSAVAEYLKAIACARLGKKEKGLRHFAEACEIEPSMEYRGKLDPEITLLKELKDEEDKTIEKND